MQRKEQIKAKKYFDIPALFAAGLLQKKIKNIDTYAPCMRQAKS